VKEMYLLAKKFADSEMLPHAAEWDVKQHLPMDVLKKLGEMGFAGKKTTQC